MKKLVTIATAVSVLAFIACGPSAEEKAKAQHMKDSLAKDSSDRAAAMQAQMMQHHNDSIRMAMRADSTRRADSAAAAAAKPGKK